MKIYNPQNNDGQRSKNLITQDVAFYFYSLSAFLILLLFICICCKQEKFLFFKMGSFGGKTRAWLYRQEKNDASNPNNQSVDGKTVLKETIILTSGINQL